MIEFDRKIGFALLFAMFIEAAAGLIWAGRAAERIDQLEHALEIQRPIAERLARLEAQMSDMQSTLDRVDARIAREERR
jgi:hypothetical protein